MSYNSNKDRRVHVKRLPFIDRTNFISPEHSTLPPKSYVESYMTTDPKLKLVSKVHLQSCSAVSNKHRVNTTHCVKSPVGINSKLELILEVINKHTYTSHNLQSLTDSTKKIISNDPKFTLIPKVNLQRLHLHAKIPLCTRSHKNGGMPKISSKKRATSNGKIKTTKRIPKAPLVSEKVIPNKTKITLEPFVLLTRSEEIESAQKCNNKSQNTMKKVQFTEEINTLPKFDKALRKRKTKNYAEISIKDTPSPKKKLEQSCIGHIPVYLQKTVSEQIEIPDDPYEFKLRSPTSKSKGKRRPRRPLKNLKDVSDSDSAIYDKSMHEALKQIKQKVNTKKCKPVRQIKKLQQNNKVQVKNSQLQIASSNAARINAQKDRLAPSNIKVTARPSDMKKQVIEANEQNLNKISNKNTEKLISSGKEKIPLNVAENQSRLKLLTQEINRSISRLSSQNPIKEPKPDDLANCFGFDDDYEDDFNISKVLPPPPPRLVSSGKTTTDKLKQAFAATSTPKPSSKKKIHVISNVLMVRDNTDTTGAACFVETKSGDFLGFNYSSVHASNSASVTSKTPQNVVTSSNRALIDSTIDRSTNTTEKDIRSFVNNRLTNKKQTRGSHPWRGDRLQLKRNPHFLTIKDTSLPCYNQQMILEPKLLERPKTPIPRRKTRSNKVQTSILDFVSSNKINNESTPTKKHHNMSLFDDAEFSPIKDYNMQANTSPMDTPKRKRNIFGLHKNKNQTSPLRERNREEEFGLENYFGFDSPVHKHRIGKENVRIIRKRNKLNEEDLPMRVPIDQVKRIREEAVEELLDGINLENIPEEPSGQEMEENVLPSENSQAENIPHVGIFEDLAEVKPLPRVYERKRSKRIRARSVSTDTEEVVEKRKRKRRDVFTLAEEEEYDKWAKEFNAMCNEIEKHDLTLA